MKKVIESSIMKSEVSSFSADMISIINYGGALCVNRNDRFYLINTSDESAEPFPEHISTEQEAFKHLHSVEEWFSSGCKYMSDLLLEGLVKTKRIELSQKDGLLDHFDQWLFRKSTWNEVEAGVWESVNTMAECELKAKERIGEHVDACSIESMSESDREALIDQIAEHVDIKEIVRRFKIEEPSGFKMILRGIAKLIKGN